MSNTAPDLTGKIVVVTGASAGIGKQTAIGLARLGATMILVSREVERGEAALQDVRRASGGRNTVLMTCDLSSQKSIRQLAREIKRNYAGLDVLVNNAGVFMPRR